MRLCLPLHQYLHRKEVTAILLLVAFHSRAAYLGSAIAIIFALTHTLKNHKEVLYA